MSRAKLLWTQPLQDKTPVQVVLLLPTKDVSSRFMELRLTFKGKIQLWVRTDVLVLTG